MTKNSREQRNAARRKKYAIKTRKDKIMKEAKKKFQDLANNRYRTSESRARKAEREQFAR
jgi:hypothetical protein